MRKGTTMHENTQINRRRVPRNPSGQYGVQRIPRNPQQQERRYNPQERRIPRNPQQQGRQYNPQERRMPRNPQRQGRQYDPQHNPQRADYRIRERQRQRQRQRRARLRRRWMLIMFAVILAVLIGEVWFLRHQFTADKEVPAVQNILEDVFPFKNKVEKPEVEENFLTVSEYNRPGEKLPKVKNIFVHYTANPGTTAAQNRSYFESLGETHERAASAHFIIGYNGEIVQCIPLDEEAYAVAGRNEDSVSIECCYIDENGKFTQETYASLVHLLAWLVAEYHLGPEDIVRHYDSNGKLCPLYYVEHEDEWMQLRRDVAAYR